VAEAASPLVSVVIPAFNEARIISQTLEAVRKYFAIQGSSYEVLVVDDGSQDRTTAIVRDVAARDASVRLLAGPHRGKGAAVRTGVLAARGRWTVFMDADQSTPIDQWERFVPFLAAGANVVIGSRKTPGASVEVHQSPLREFLGRTFTNLTHILVVRASDVTCGFKAFDTAVAKHIFSLQRLDGWAFDAEALFIAKRLGHRIYEVPVVWRNDPATKVRMLRDGIAAFRDLLWIRAGVWLGRYPRT
jgi:dolichyl-phosphate beta-glucosyltransferase